MDVQATISLTDREEFFILALCLGQRPTNAAATSGYSKASARNLLVKPHIAAAVRHCAANLVRAVAVIDKAAA